MGAAEETAGEPPRQGEEQLPKMSFGDHLEELRRRMFRSLIAVSICVLAALPFKTEITGIYVAPYRSMWIKLFEDHSVHVAERITEPDATKGFILDGFPRTVPQADALKESLRELGKDISAVVSLEVDTEALVVRLTGRRTCRQCGQGYHVSFDPPAKDGICDNCAGELFQRDDDQEATIRNRLQVYHDQTAPLVAYYEQDGLVAAIDGMQEIDVVRSDILAALGTA